MPCMPGEKRDLFRRIAVPQSIVEMEILKLVRPDEGFGVVLWLAASLPRYELRADRRVQDVSQDSARIG